MKRNAGIVLLAWVTAIGWAGPGHTESAPAAAVKKAAPAQAASPVASTTQAMPSFAGAWRLDPSQSTRPQRPMGGPGGPRPGNVGGPGGGASGGPRDAGPDGGASGDPGARMPPGSSGGDRPRGEGRGDRMRRGPGGFQRAFLRIEQKGGLLTIADSAGVAVQEIAFDDAAPPAAGGVRRLGGEWTGKSLMALGETPMGGMLTEEYTLRDPGGTLEIRTKILAEDDRPAREFVRVYHRVKVK